MSDDTSPQGQQDLERLQELAGIAPTQRQEFELGNNPYSSEELQYLVNYRIAGATESSKGSYNERIAALKDNLTEICPSLEHDATSSWLISTSIKNASEIRRKISGAIDEQIDILHVTQIIVKNRAEK
jgi:hypothetical protein